MKHRNKVFSGLENHGFSKLWDKGHDLNKKAEKFTVGDDCLLDQKLLYWDCVASIAHASMLKKIGILTEKEFYEIKKRLLEIIELDKKGKFQIKQEQEDSHTAIENYLTGKLGETGQKIHTARSRNDQSFVNIKLYMKNEMLGTQEAILELCKALLLFSRKNNVVFPGYTHMQKAMPSNVSLWAASFIDSMIDNLMYIDSLYKIIDSCPLGSAAGYGVPLEIDRKYVSDLLGFSEVQDNAIYVQSSRGKTEAMLLSSLANIMQDLNKLATDLILFSMPEFGYFELPQEFCRGRSIMPQKKNPDVLELLRAKSSVVLSLYLQAMSLIQNLPTGYNRDFQLAKKPLIEGIDITKESLSIAAEILGKLKIDKEKCRAAMSKELFATDLAYEYVKKGMPFRKAYKTAAENIDEIKTESFIGRYNMKLDLDAAEKEIKDIEDKLTEKKKFLIGKIASLLN